ncbi:glycosyltransferase [Aeoliella sp. ICT_H6.2]|uniref:Glycosyltransferase n=1 Tax=Aeoliella straminimaris TaxID=2954799 RepID=A0A9X2FHX2_9BACT|nr:glycosyltransferase [Aeoliella straminimaris]MCO6045346.1 glycosyltransferase [Aeoliella straminimaris]
MIHYITTDGVGNATVANELQQLGKQKVPFVLHAMRRPRSLFHAAHAVSELRDRTHYLYPLPPLKSLLSFVLGPVLFGRKFFQVGWNALTGRRENLRGRVASLAHFFVACHWARKLRHEDVDHIHSQWAHSCATIGMYGAWLAGRSFSFTGHACDLFRDRVALCDKIDRAEFIVCISEFHREFYIKQGADPCKLVLVYCGIDPQRFSRQSVERESSVVRINSVSRLVEKKGYSYLIEACQLLHKRGVDFRCVIGGSGPLERSLRDQVQRLGLGDHIDVTGQTVTQEELSTFLSNADIFCLPCVWAADQDVDGLPQTLMEAMSCETPVVSTHLVGIPDLVVDEETGLLVEPENAEQLATALMRLCSDSELRKRLAVAGRALVVQKFNIHTCLQPLVERFRSKLQADAVEAPASDVEPSPAR